MQLLLGLFGSFFCSDGFWFRLLPWSPSEMDKICIFKRCLPVIFLQKTLPSFSSGQFYVYYLSYFCFVIAACEHMALWTQLLLHSGSLLHVLTGLDWKIPDLTPFPAQFSLYSCLILQLFRVNCCALPKSENLRNGLWTGTGTCLKRHSMLLMDDGWRHRFQPAGARSEPAPHSMKHIAGHMPKTGKTGLFPNSAATGVPQNLGRSGPTPSTACPRDPI